MLSDIAEECLVLYVERKTLDVESYKLLADFAKQNELSLKLGKGNFIISNHALPRIDAAALTSRFLKRFSENGT